MWNGFKYVPPALRSATALQDLDMRNQHGEHSGLDLSGSTAGRNVGGWAQVGRLLTLCDLPDLRRVHVGPGAFPELPEFHRRRPDVVVFVA